jgi:hypothetical protein
MELFLLDRQKPLASSQYGTVSDFPALSDLYGLMHDSRWYDMDVWCPYQARDEFLGISMRMSPGCRTPSTSSYASSLWATSNGYSSGCGIITYRSYVHSPMNRCELSQQVAGLSESISSALPYYHAVAQDHQLNV